MSIEPIVFVELVITVFILGIALTILAISYAKFMQKFGHFQNEENNIISRSHKKASEIIDEAQNKAQKIIQDANSFEEARKKTLYEQLNIATLVHLKTFEKTAQEIIKIYQKELESLKDINIKNVKNISKDIESTTLVELRDFREILKKETYASQKIVETKIEEDYEAAKKAIESYKAERAKKVDEEIYKILKTVSRLVLGKTLPLEVHEQLVIDALSIAKQEGVIR